MISNQFTGHYGHSKVTFLKYFFNREFSTLTFHFDSNRTYVCKEEGILNIYKNQSPNCLLFLPESDNYTHEV